MKCKYCEKQIPPSTVHLHLTETRGSGCLHDILGEFCDYECLSVWVVEHNKSDST